MADLGPTLLTLARDAIATRFGQPHSTVVDRPELHQLGATFVTLTQNGALRGCIGSLEAWRPLGKDVHENALAAAFRDPRFRPLIADELANTYVEVSLLTPAEPLSFTSEVNALAQLRPNIDGVIFSAGNHRSTFLPQVWEQLPDAASFMVHLKQKSGLPGDYWGPDVHLERYQVQKWKENGC